MNFKLNLLTCLVLVAMSSQVFGQKMSKEERQKALNHLKATQDELNNVVSGLTEEQLNFYPSEDGWSIAPVRGTHCHF